MDFKIVPLPASPVSRSALRRQLERMPHNVSEALPAAGFAFDLTDKSVAWARNEGRYAVWQLPYACNAALQCSPRQARTLPEGANDTYLLHKEPPDPAVIWGMSANRSQRSSRDGSVTLRPATGYWTGKWWNWA